MSASAMDDRNRNSHPVSKYDAQVAVVKCTCRWGGLRWSSSMLDVGPRSRSQGQHDEDVRQFWEEPRSVFVCRVLGVAWTIAVSSFSQRACT